MSEEDSWVSIPAVKPATPNVLEASVLSGFDIMIFDPVDDVEFGLRTGEPDTAEIFGKLVCCMEAWLKTGMF